MSIPSPESRSEESDALHLGLHFLSISDLSSVIVRLHVVQAVYKTSVGPFISHSDKFKVPHTASLSPAENQKSNSLSYIPRPFQLSINCLQHSFSPQFVLGNSQEIGQGQETIASESFLSDQKSCSLDGEEKILSNFSMPLALTATTNG